MPLPVLGTHTIVVAVLHQNLTGFTLGTPLPSESVVGLSVAPILVHVQRRSNPADFIPHNGKTRLTMFWEPWFTPHNWDWSLAEMVPLVGQYSSIDITDQNSTFAEANRNAIRQHCLWWAMSGITAIGVDWTNNIWNLQNWDDRGL